MRGLDFPQIHVELPFQIPVNNIEKSFISNFMVNDVCFNATKALFWFSKQFLKVEIPSFSQTVFHIYEQKCISELMHLNVREYPAQIVQQVMDYLVLQNIVMPIMSETALVLDIPERTLRYQLQQ